MLGDTIPPATATLRREHVSARSPVARLATAPAVRVPGTATVVQAVVAMRSAGATGALVGDAEGIITERDITWAFADGRARTDPVSSVATYQPLTVPASTSVVEAAALLLDESMQHLVVELDGGDFAMVTLNDLLVALLRDADPGLWLESLGVAVDVPSEIWLG